MLGGRLTTIALQNVSAQSLQQQQRGLATLKDSMLSMRYSDFMYTFQYRCV
jgi:hypothetical protein